MRNVILCLICLFLNVFIWQNPVCAEDTSNKVLVESLDNFSFENHNGIVQFKVLEENAFENGIKFEEGTVITAKAAKIIDPKRGKRDGYLVIDPETYSVPSTGQVLKITDKNWMANVLGYKPFDVKNAAVGAGLFAAGMAVKGIGQMYYFGKGVISPEEGENRLKSGVKNVYENSPLAYVEEGHEVNIKTGDILLIKFYHQDVPKWRVRKRNR